jgi:hypothetical protein
MRNARSLTLLLGLLASGCFTMRHELPAGSHFGRRPDAAASAGAPFERAASKNYALAGLVPYSDFSASDLLEPAQPSLELREIETVFSPYDVAVSIVPGLLYGYYVWAPRTVRVRGSAARAPTGDAD